MYIIYIYVCVYTYMCVCVCISHVYMGYTERERDVYYKELAHVIVQKTSVPPPRQSDKET